MTVERLCTRDVPVGELTFFPGNARRGQVAEIRKSVRRLGQYRSVVVRQTDDALVILAGNHTVRAMKAEQHETVSCEIVRCTDDEARRVNLGDNRLSDIADDDPDALAELLSYLDGDYEGTGWDEEAVQHLIDPPLPDDPDGGAGEDSFSFGVVVVCASKTDQQATCDDLLGRGLDARIVKFGDTILKAMK